MESFFNPTKLNRAKYDKYVEGHKKKKKKRQDWKSSSAHIFFKIMVIPMRYGTLRCQTTTIPDMVKMIIVYKSNIDSECKTFLD